MPSWGLRIMLPQGSHRSECPALIPGAIFMSGPKLWLEAISGSLVLPQPESMLRSVALVATRDRATA